MTEIPWWVVSVALVLGVAAVYKLAQTERILREFRDELSTLNTKLTDD